MRGLLVLLVCLPAAAAPYDTLVAVKSYGGEVQCKVDFDQKLSTGKDGHQAFSDVHVHQSFSQRFAVVSDPSGSAESPVWSGKLTSASGTVNESLLQTVDGLAYQSVKVTGSGPLLFDETDATAASLSMDLKAGTFTVGTPGPSLRATLINGALGPGGKLQELPPDSTQQSLERPRFPELKLPAQGTSLTASFTVKESLSAKAGGAPAEGDWRCTVSIAPTGPEKLEAIIEPIAPLERGATLRLDGAGSTPRGGKITRFEWSFENVRCPGSSVTPKVAKREGDRTSIVVLCPLTVRLTVFQGSKKADATVSVDVTKREWKLPFSVDAAERPSGVPLPAVTGRDGHIVSGGWEGAQLACADDASLKDAGHNLHPARQGTSWRDRGYHVKKVSDPKGPFDGLAYLEDTALAVHRALYINEGILPTGRPSPSYAKTNFYAENKKRGTDVDGYLAAARAHELEGSKGMKGHAFLLREAVAATKLMDDLEPLVGASEADVVTRADRFICLEENRIAQHAKDPLPENWRGKLWVTDPATMLWYEGTTAVGGEGTGTAPPGRPPPTCP